MTGTLNKVILIGHLGDDVKIHNFKVVDVLEDFLLRQMNLTQTNKQTKKSLVLNGITL